jgi:DinB superfamily
LSAIASVQSQQITGSGLGTPVLRPLLSWGEAMDHNLEYTIALLTRTPAVLNALLRDLPEFWVARNEGGETWTATEVVGHLIDADRVNWMPRARHILESGDMRPFASFDRGGHARECAGKTLARLLDEFASLRAENLATLWSFALTPPDFARPGLHSALGPVTLSQLLSTWAAHDLTHVHQITRILAHQYREAVGPWQKFLGVLHCNGHSAPA